MPFSGPPPNENILRSPQQNSGVADVPTAQSTQNNSGTSIIFNSGTSAFVGPDQVVSWYQSGTTANVPITQSTAALSGNNSLYSGISNSQRAPFQSSGVSPPTANVPASEASGPSR